MRQCVPSNVASFIEAQIRLCNITTNGRRWSPPNPHLPLTCISIVHVDTGFVGRCSSCHVLQLWMKHIPLRPAFSSDVLEMLKRKVANFAELEFDETHIKRELQYNAVGDCFEGFETCEDTTEARLANKALLFMARDICTPWKQVLGYFFAYRAASASDLEERILECYLKLIKAGLCPKAVVCDQGAQNVSRFEKLVSVEKAVRHRGW